ncbi:MAG: 2-dehydro-3-deoxyphosphogluconate aldolase [Acidobacteria bacterium SCN 69-37]|nr:MAG: 2-dehydro-3-deoxyphosphogluconate aldolase [Acidobacteria bacterium SCN 69-37]
MSIEQTLAAIEDAGVVAVIRLDDPSRLSDVVAALVEGGVRALEVTMTVPGAVDHIRRLAANLPDRFLLGAGTVTDSETVARVVDAGARFIVSPVFRPAIVEAAIAHGVPAAPGCFSPTEVLDAWERGARLIKIFPATALGPSYLKDLRGPMPYLKLMPTGGVTVDNAGDWIAAGAVAVGIGTSLLDTKAIADGRFEVIVEKSRTIVANVARARGAK